MSPKLFSIYVNDMILEVLNSNLTVKHYHIDLGIILYADDTTIICDSLAKLQATMNIINSYCAKTEICINAKKTKLMCTYGSYNGSEIKIGNETLTWEKEF